MARLVYTQRRGKETLYSPHHTGSWLVRWFSFQDSSNLYVSVCLFVCPHLGSAISADCLTRPQYVLKSYFDAGKSRLPGSEADMSEGEANGTASISPQRFLERTESPCPLLKCETLK